MRSLFKSSRNSKENQARADVKVIVRKRPVTGSEMDILRAVPPKVLVQEAKTKVDLTKYITEHHFSYDDSFGEFDDTRCVYNRCIQPLVDNVFEGGTSTAFCFGQTVQTQAGTTDSTQCVI